MWGGHGFGRRGVGGHGEPDADERGGRPDGDPDDMGMRGRMGMMQRPQMPQMPMRGALGGALGGMMGGRGNYPPPRGPQPQGGMVSEDDPRFRGMVR